MIFDAEHLRTMRSLAAHPEWVLGLLPQSSSTAVSSKLLLQVTVRYPRTTSNNRGNSSCHGSLSTPPHHLHLLVLNVLGLLLPSLRLDLVVTDVYAERRGVL
jgi:hypothetical protein